MGNPSEEHIETESSPPDQGKRFGGGATSSKPIGFDLREQSLGCRIAALRALMRSDPESAGNKAQFILSSEKSLPLMEMEAMIESLGLWGGLTSHYTLLDIVLNSPHPRAKSVALISLASVSPNIAVGIAYSWAWYSPDLRGVAIRALGRIDDPSADLALKEIADSGIQCQASDLARRILSMKQDTNGK